MSGLPRIWNENSYSAKQRNVVAPDERFTQGAQYHCASTAWGEDPGDRTRSACSNREVAWHGCCNAHAVFVPTYPPPRPAPQPRAGRKLADATGLPGLPAPDPRWPSLVSRRVPPGRAGKQASLSRPSSLYARPRQTARRTRCSEDTPPFQVFLLPPVDSECHHIGSKACLTRQGLFDWPARYSDERPPLGRTHAARGGSRS